MNNTHITHAQSFVMHSHSSMDSHLKPSSSLGAKRAQQFPLTTSGIICKVVMRLACISVGMEA